MNQPAKHIINYLNFKQFRHMRRFFLAALTGFLLSGQIYGQSYTKQQESLPCLNKKFTIVAHIFKDSLGQYGVTEPDITKSIEDMNVFFKPICVSFEVCKFLYHDNFQHDTLDKENETMEIATKYNLDYRINVYYLTYLGLPSINYDISGLATLNGIAKADNNAYILIEKGSLSAINHEMGHYFNLLHTFEGNGAELVNGSNCDTTGDLVCDTPGDPYVAGDPLPIYIDMNNNCRFISGKQDANQEYYNPDVGNIMSYYNCGPSGFTWGQFDRMVKAYLASDQKYW